MSVEAFSWALTVPVGGNQKVILLGLANHAHPDGTESYPALDTLADYAHCDRSTARRNVRKLVADGWAIEDGLGPKGQVKYRLPLDRSEPRNGGGKMPRGETQGGGTSASQGVAPMPPEPSIEPSLRKESARPAREQIPDDFPDELRPHAREVMRILKAVAEQHGARKVWPQRVALVVMAHPRHALVGQAHRLAAWAVDAKRPIKDVVSTYTGFLERDGEMAARERLAEDGTPTAAAPARGGNVHPIAAARKPTHDELLHELRAANPRLQGDHRQLGSGA